jgi:hypothetical protein
VRSGELFNPRILSSVILRTTPLPPTYSEVAPGLTAPSPVPRTEPFQRFNAFIYVGSVKSFAPSPCKMPPDIFESPGPAVLSPKLYPFPSPIAQPKEDPGHWLGLVRVSAGLQSAGVAILFLSRFTHFLLEAQKPHPGRAAHVPQSLNELHGHPLSLVTLANPPLGSAEPSEIDLPAPSIFIHLLILLIQPHDGVLAHFAQSVTVEQGVGGHVGASVTIQLEHTAFV